MSDYKVYEVTIRAKHPETNWDGTETVIARNSAEAIREAKRITERAGHMTRLDGPLYYRAKFISNDVDLYRDKPETRDDDEDIGLFRNREGGAQVNIAHELLKVAKLISAKLEVQEEEHPRGIVLFVKAERTTSYPRRIAKIMTAPQDANALESLAVRQHLEDKVLFWANKFVRFPAAFEKAVRRGEITALDTPIESYFVH